MKKPHQDKLMIPSISSMYQLQMQALNIAIINDAINKTIDIYILFSAELILTLSHFLYNALHIHRYKNAPLPKSDECHTNSQM